MGPKGGAEGWGRRMGPKDGIDRGRMTGTQRHNRKGRKRGAARALPSLLASVTGWAGVWWLAPVLGAGFSASGRAAGGVPAWMMFVGGICLSVALCGLVLSWRLMRQRGEVWRQALSVDGWSQWVFGLSGVAIAAGVLGGEWAASAGVVPALVPGMMGLFHQLGREKTRERHKPEARTPAAGRPWVRCSRGRVALVALVDMGLLLAGLSLVDSVTATLRIGVGDPQWGIAALSVLTVVVFASPGGWLLAAMRDPDAPGKYLVERRVLGRETAYTLVLGLVVLAAGVVWLTLWPHWVRSGSLLGIRLWPSAFLIWNLSWAAGLVVAGCGLCRTWTWSPLLAAVVTGAGSVVVLGNRDLWLVGLPRVIGNHGLAELLTTLLALALLVMLGGIWAAFWFAWLRLLGEPDGLSVSPTLPGPDVPSKKTAADPPYGEH